MSGHSGSQIPGRLHPEARWKGVLASACRSAVLDLLGPVPVEEFRQTLSPGGREFLDERYLATAWYAETASGEVLEKLARALGETEAEVALKVGARSVDLSAGQLGRWLLQFIATPERFAGYSGQVWSRMRDGQLVSSLNSGASPAGREIITCELSGWHGHHPLSCLATVGAMNELGENMRGVRWLGFQRTACISSGAPCCKYELAFQR